MAIKLLPVATVGAGELRVRDFAVVEGDDAALKKKIDALVVTKAVKDSGAHRWVNAERLADEVREAVGVDVVLRGTSACRIDVKGESFGGDAILAIAEQALLMALSQRYYSVDVRPTTMPRGVSKPHADAELVTRIPGLTPDKRMVVWVDVVSNGFRVSSVPVWFAVEAYTDGWVATHDLFRSDSLRASDWAPTSVDVAALGGRVPYSRMPLDAMRLMRDYVANQPLTMDAIDAIPDVRVGQALAMSVRSGSIAVVVNTLALADGATGDTIPVRAKSDENKKWLVKIVSPTTAEVLDDRVH